jgi:hypothetical protein
VCAPPGLLWPCTPCGCGCVVVLTLTFSSGSPPAPLARSAACGRARLWCKTGLGRRQRLVHGRGRGVEGGGGCVLIFGCCSFRAHAVLVLCWVQAQREAARSSKFDRRHLYLEREGFIRDDDSANVPPADMVKRRRSTKERSVRGLPPCHPLCPPSPPTPPTLTLTTHTTRTHPHHPPSPTPPPTHHPHLP